MPGILIRCDGSAELGLGHVVRCLSLAQEFRQRGARVGFAMRGSEVGIRMVQEAGFDVLRPPKSHQFDYLSWLAECLGHVQAHALVADVRDDLPLTTLEELRAESTRIAVIDDLSERRLAADLAVYPPVPQVSRLKWNGFRGQLFVGWEWAVVRSQFATARRPQRSGNRGILIMMGGSDPAGLTMSAVRALDRLAAPIRAIVVVGRAFVHSEALSNVLRRTRHEFFVQQNVSDVAAIMAEAQVAVCAFGVTAYELAAMGVPAVYVCPTEDHAESASAFEAAGLGVSIGVVGQDVEEKLADAVGLQLSDKRLQERTSARGRQLVDGQGARRVAEEVLRMFQRTEFPSAAERPRR
ncbi:MAG: PseG/SpsG family protein [Terriglobales bacterium]